MKRYLMFLLVLLVGCTGCINVNGEIRDKNEAVETKHQLIKPHVVVAMTDSGINPYHEIFRRINWTQNPSNYIGYPLEGLECLNLTFGDDYFENVESDSDLWDGLESEKLYWIPQTNILAIYIGEEETDDVQILDSDGHGTSVAGIVASTCENATIVMMCGSKTKGAQWASNQSWIDIFFSSSVENNFEGDSTSLYTRNLAAATEAIWKNGGVICMGAGNNPWPSIMPLPRIPTTPYMPAGYANPPWIVIVGGGQNETKGQTVLAGTTPDVLSDYIQRVAKPGMIHGLNTGSAGTSFSTPKAAGVMAKILYTLRQMTNYTAGISSGCLIYNVTGFKGLLADGNLDNWEMRDLLNKSAVYWQATEYSPQNSTYWFNASTSNITLLAGTLALCASGATIPINSAIPAIQMGWGYVGPEIVNIAVKIALGEMEAPDKGINAEYMKQEYALRVAYWENYPK